MYMSCHQLYLFSPHQRIQVNTRFSSNVLLFPCRYDTRLYSSCACQISTLRVFKICDGFCYGSLQLCNFSKKKKAQDTLDMKISYHQVYLFSPKQRIQVNTRFSSNVLLFPCKYDARLYSLCACQILTLPKVSVKFFYFCRGTLKELNHHNNNIHNLKNFFVRQRMLKITLNKFP